MLKSYVKRSGRVTTAQKNAFDTFSEQYLIPFKEEEIDLAELFKNNDITLEIGFGSGIATAQIAQDNPNKNYIGIDVHRPGIGHLLMEIQNRKLDNLKIIEYDAAIVLEKMIPVSSLEAIHIFFPDPWPKKRHRKRRLVQKPFTETLANCLKPDGYLYFVTDWEDYAVHALEELSAVTLLKNKYEGFAEPQSWRPKTKFEQKGLVKGHIIRELLFIRENK